jgi:hypothetical protein
VGENGGGVDNAVFLPLAPDARHTLGCKTKYNERLIMIDREMSKASNQMKSALYLTIFENKSQVNDSIHKIEFF